MRFDGKRCRDWFIWGRFFPGCFFKSTLSSAHSPIVFDVLGQISGLLDSKGVVGAGAVCRELWWCAIQVSRCISSFGDLPNVSIAR